MANWQKQVNSQLRLTPLLQRVSVDYQSNSGIGGEDKGSAARYGSHNSPRETSTPPSFDLIFSSPCCVGIQVKPVECSKLGILLTPKADLSVSLQRKPWADCVWQDPRNRFLGCPHWFYQGLLAHFHVQQCLRVSSTFIQFLYPLAPYDWHSHGRGLEVTTKHLCF